MASLAQLKANQENALLSCGPRTAAGKAKCSRNALKHGLLSMSVLMRGEKEEQFRDLRDGLMEELLPTGDLECVLFDRIVSAAWRLKRVLQLEAGILDLGYYSEVLNRERHRITHGEEIEPRTPSLYLRDEDGPEARRWRPVLERIRDCLVALDSENVSLAKSFVRDAAGPEALSKLKRYESAIERSLYRAIHELQRVQAARRGNPVPPPIAIDVGLYGAGSK